MRKFVFVIIALFFVYVSNAQKSYSDSLLNIITTSKDVQTRVEAARFYTWHYAFKGADSVAYCANRLIQIGKSKEYDDITATGKACMSYSEFLTNSTYRALSLNIEALRLAEKVQNDFLIAYIYIGYGNTYNLFNQEKSIEYYKKSLRYLDGSSSSASNILRRSLLINLGNHFVENKQYDSAFAYLKKAEEITVLFNDPSQSSGSLYSSLGSMYLGLNQPKLAYAYYKQGLESTIRFNDDRNKRNAYVGLAEYYMATGELDSALNYLNSAQEGLDLGKPGKSWVKSADMLYEIYKAKGNDKYALKNLEISRTLQLKGDSAAQLQQIQALSFEEDQRQMAVAAEKEKLIEERKHNLQYAAIALGVVLIVILFFLLSHSIIANQRVIKFLGVLALLIVFEFLNLLLHPYIGKLTHHSPVMMLGIMVCIAALLIPLHHKLEHWITDNMVEKNKKIRLAAANKTIEQLERSTDAQHDL
jgi:tetratricopeptide (TPR) repeat protein